MERKRLRDKSAASAAKIKEEMQAQGLEVTRLKKLGEAQAREHQAQSGHLQEEQEQEKAKRETKGLRKQMREDTRPSRRRHRTSRVCVGGKSRY